MSCTYTIFVLSNAHMVTSKFIYPIHPSLFSKEVMCHTIDLAILILR